MKGVMNMNKVKKILLFLILLSIFVVVPTILLYENCDTLKDPHNDNWYIDIVTAASIEHIRASESEEQPMQAIDFHFTGYDNDIVMENRTKEEKVFPFQGIDVTLETRNQKYVVYMIVDENGQLQIERYEKSDHFNPLA